MRQLFNFAMLFMALTLSFVACNENPETQPTSEATQVKLFDAVFYVSQKTYVLQFITEGTEVGEKSVTNGTLFSFTIKYDNGEEANLPKGTYTLDDMINVAKLTYVETDKGQTLYKEVTLNFDNSKVTAKMVDVNGKEYNIICNDNIVFEEFGDNGGGNENPYEDEPEEQSTMNFTATNIDATYTTYAEYSMSEGFFTISDSEKAIDLYLSLAMNADYKGSFPINDTYMNNTILASDGFQYDEPQPSCMYNIGAGETKVAPYYFFASGTVTITENSITINATSHFGSTINATYNGAINPTIVNR